ncbi:MAG: hypothetical protein AAB375_00525 [Patescibacteria group bacterium]
MFLLIFGLMSALPPQEPPNQLALTAQFGWQAYSAADPFGRNGIESFTASAPNGQLVVSGKTWYAKVSGRLLRGPVSGNTVDAEIQRHITLLGPIRIGIGLEGSDMGFFHSVARIGDTTLATDQQFRIALANVDFGLGAYNRNNVRIAFTAGYLTNIYESVLTVPSFVGNEPLVNDQCAVAGGRIRASDIRLLRDRLILNGSVEYLRIIGTRSAYTPDSELSGTAEATTRIGGNAQHGLHIGVYGQLTRAEVSLRSSSSYGLRLIWKVR